MDARTAYQVAVNLYTQENAVTWARFNIMLAANSLIVTATGFAAGRGNRLVLLAIVLPVVGGLLCFFWWNMMTRGFAYHDVWRDAAYALERRWFAEHVLTLHHGENLRRCRRATIPIHRAAEPRPQHTAGVLGARARTYARWVISLFFVLYLSALLQIGVIVCFGPAVELFGLPLSEKLGLEPSRCEAPLVQG